MEASMALVNCPDCGKQVSTEAIACPGCGRPVKAQGGWSGAPTTVVASSPDRPVVVEAVKSRGVFIILGVLLGCLGIHNFYAGYNGKGAVQLIITLTLGWLIIGLVITALWALVEVCTVTMDAKGNRLS